MNHRPLFGVLRRLVRLETRRRLPTMQDCHPEIAIAQRIDVGLQEVEVSRIRGTAARQSARDDRFRPARDFRPADWEARWQRLQDGASALAVLPPVDLLLVGDGYWVVDGHNRVALALAHGQLEIDANVTLLTPRGGPRASTALRSEGLAPALESAAIVRAAGTGRLSRTAPALSMRGSYAWPRQRGPVCCPDPCTAIAGTACL